MHRPAESAEPGTVIAAWRAHSPDYVEHNLKQSCDPEMEEAARQDHDKSAALLERLSALLPEAAIA